MCAVRGMKEYLEDSGAGVLFLLESDQGGFHAGPGEDQNTEGRGWFV